MKAGRASRTVRAVLAVAAMVAVAATLPATPAAAAEAPFTATLSASTGLVDGQEVTLTLGGTAPPAGWEFQARICRGGVSYQADADFPANDLRNRNCPPVGQGPSESWVQVEGRVGSGPFEATRVFYMATGSNGWQVQKPASTELETVTYSCDADNPCSLVVRMIDGGSRSLVALVAIPLTFASEAQAAGCAGRAPGILRHLAPQRMPSVVRHWNRLACEQEGSLGLMTSGSAGDEVEALSAFGRGETDIAYSGMGYRPDPDVPARPWVAVPVALNAVVMAAGNGYTQPDGTVLPYRDLALTLDEVNLLLNTTNWSIYLDERQGLLAKLVERNNPQFGPPPPDGPAFNTRIWHLPRTPSPDATIVASEADATTWLVTRHLAANLGARWQVFDTTSDAEEGTPRGTALSFARVEPPFHHLATFTGQLSSLRGKQLARHVELQRALVNNPNGVPNKPGGPLWAVTDLAEARQLGLSVVHLMQNDTASPVAPTPATMATAADRMVLSEGDWRLPDPATSLGVRRQLSPDVRRVRRRPCPGAPRARRRGRALPGAHRLPEAPP